MGQTVSRKIHRQCRPCGFGCCLSDGALFLCGAYRHNDVGRGAGFFPLCDSLHGRTLRLPGESAVFQSVNDRFPYSGLLHAAGYPGEADRETGPRSDGNCRVSFHYGLAHGAVVPCYAGSRSCRNVCRYDELPKEMGGRGQSREP